VTPSASEFVKSTGARAAWQSGDTGSGVGVAVIDTGISNMNDLTGRVTWGPDLSGEGSTIDTYGHGTVMAGLIGGTGADSASNQGGFTGIAPGANLIAVKTAGYNGAADVSTILQAFTWVAAYQAQYNIRVVNLSWGTPSTQDPRIDPLDYAVERLWNSGIVVVVAAGNAGPGPGTITKPGDDPMVLTVGAYDDQKGTTGDTIPAWSSRGPTKAGVTKPDLVAPGRTLIALRSYGSNVEVNNPLSLIAPSYITGSGTSEATAVTSGLVALVIAAHPTWTPDQVKATLKATASRLNGYGANEQGSGRVQVAKAMAASPGPATWQASPATGLGSIEASRGGNDVVALCNGVVTSIIGEIDVRCEEWNPAAWVGHSWTGASWTGSSWTGGTWTGGTWTGHSWTGSSWTGHSWTGDSWTGHSWTGHSWTGASWTGSSWTGHSWSTVNCPTAATTGKQQTAFWGKHPKRGLKVNGEVSDL
jgi:serine protease AprX